MIAAPHSGDGGPRDGERRPSGERREAGTKQNERRPGRLEWAVGGLATAMVLAALGFLVHEAWTGTSLPPLVSLSAGRVTPLPGDGGYVVEVTAINSGGTTAQGLTIEGALRDRDGRVTETSSATLQWVPAHAERAGGLFFRRDPRLHRLELSPKGYERP